jgi:hypothetical protein
LGSSFLKVGGHEVTVELLIGSVVLLREVVNLQDSRRYETPLRIEPGEDKKEAKSSVSDPDCG